MDKTVDHSAVDDRLDVVFGAGSHIADGPSHFFPNGFFVVTEEFIHYLEGTGVKSQLRLFIGASQDVTEGPQASY